MTYKKPCPENGILNTASIQSGSGLGTDSVFTGIIQNFVKNLVLIKILQESLPFLFQSY